jgi:hypothetical protein
LEEVLARRQSWDDVSDEVWDGIAHLRPVGAQPTLQHEIADLLQ